MIELEEKLVRLKFSGPVEEGGRRVHNTRISSIVELSRARISNSLVELEVKFKFSL